ncbi:MAG: hypothetical protein ACOC0D_06720 [Spirochaeta sp.]
MTSKSVQTQLEELKNEYDQLRRVIAADERKLQEDKNRAEYLHESINELTRLTEESPEGA